MAIDLSGGLDPEFEYFLADKPADPDMRDSSTLWIMDQSGALAFPRVTFDAIGADWDRPWVQLNMVLADGKALRVWSQEPGRLALGTDCKPSIRGAGPLKFECVEPFHRWIMEFDGLVEQSTTAAQLAAEAGGTPVKLQFRFEAEMATPPWMMGGMNAEAARTMKSGDGSALMGGVRYEQLCRVKGTVNLEGKEFHISGTGMRVRRRGVRNMGAATGHVQHSALFPSGRGFGANAFAPGPDGTQPFNEAVVFTRDGQHVPARVAQAPWMRRLEAAGKVPDLVLQTQSGEIRVRVEMLLSMFDHHHFEMADSSILHQGIARYVWDGEETIGLIERCTLRDQLESG